MPKKKTTAAATESNHVRPLRDGWQDHHGALSALVAKLAGVARHDPTDVDAARAARILAAVAQSLASGMAGTAALEEIDRVARQWLAAPTAGDVRSSDIDAGLPNDTTARNELVAQCEALAKNFSAVIETRVATLPIAEPARSDALAKMFQNATCGLFCWLMMRIPRALDADTPILDLASRAGRTLAEAAEQHRSADARRYPSKEAALRVSGEDILRAVVRVTKLTMRDDFGFLANKQ